MTLPSWDIAFNPMKVRKVTMREIKIIITDMNGNMLDMQVTKTNSQLLSLFEVDPVWNVVPVSIADLNIGKIKESDDENNKC